MNKWLLPLAAVLVLACNSMSTPEEVVEDQRTAEQVIIDDLVAAFQAGALSGDRRSVETSGDVLRQNLEAAFRVMNADPERLSVIFSRANPEVEFTVEMGEREPLPSGVMADLDDSCTIRADAGYLAKIRYGQCIGRLMEGGGGGGICMKTETTRAAGDDGEFGTDDDMFTTVCVERATEF